MFLNESNNNSNDIKINLKRENQSIKTFKNSNSLFAISNINYKMKLSHSSLT